MMLAYSILVLLPLVSALPTSGSGAATTAGDAVYWWPYPTSDCGYDDVDPQPTCGKGQGLAGLERPYPFHALRHYFGTAVYKLTKDLRLAQVAMRHRSASSTELYTHVGERDVEAAIERLG